MSDNFETVRSAARLQSPWSGVITETTHAVKTARQMMQEAKLDWTASGRELRTVDGVAIPSHKAVVRDTDDRVLGVVTKGYEILQNAEAFAFADDIVQEIGGTYAGAGTFDDGKTLFIQLRMPHGGEVVKGDVVWPYMNFFNGHDGSMAVRAGLSTIRIFCANTLAAAMHEGKTAKQSIAIRHTKSMTVRLEAARTLIGLATVSFKEFLGVAQEMTKHRLVNQKALQTYFKQVFDIKDDQLGENARSRAPARLERLTDLFETGAGNELAGVRGTWWAAVNAVTQYVDHEMPTAVRGSEGMTDDAKVAATRAKRFEAGQLGSGADIKTTAFKIAREVVLR